MTKENALSFSKIYDTRQSAALTYLKKLTYKILEEKEIFQGHSNKCTVVLIKFSYNC